MRLNNAFTIIAVIFCLCQNGFAQQNMEDVVYLKDGSVIKGMIIEQVPDVSIKIKTKDGNIFVYKTKDVEKITKEEMKGDGKNLSTENITGTTKEEKSPVVACLLSFVLPGVGQFYNGEVGKGIAQEALILGGYVLAFTAGFGTETYYGYDSYTGEYYYYTLPTMTAWYPIGLGIGIISQLWSLIDAPISANRINRERTQRGYGHLFELDGKKYDIGMDLMPGYNGGKAQITFHF